MEINNKLISELLSQHVINKDLSDDVKSFITNSMLAWSDAQINTFLHLSIKNPKVHLYNQYDYVLYKIHKDWRIKELGDHDVLYDKGLCYKYNHGYLYLGQIDDTASYGDYSKYACSYKLKCFNVDTDLKMGTTFNTIDYLDILPISTIKSTKLISVIESIENR